MLSLTLMLVLVASAFTDGAQEPKKCCSSRQYTTKAAQLGARVEYGMGIPTEGYQEVVYDYDAKRLYSTTSEYDIQSNATSTIKVLQDFEAKKQYITLEDDTCYYQDITTSMPPPCVSENATFMGQGKVGLGANSMDVVSWQVREGSLLTTMAFDAQSCVPVVYSMFGNIYGMDQVMTYFYYDFQPSITDSTRLTIPKDCKPQPTAYSPWKTEL